MLIKKYLPRAPWVLSGMLSCLVLPVWATTEFKETALLISPNTAQKIDPSLQTFIQQVWMQSPAIQGAQAAIDAAKARAEGANRPLYNPDLSLDVERASANTASIGLSQTLDWGNKQGAQTQIADQEIQAAIAGLQQTHQHIAIETLSALAGYFTAREMQALALRRSELMKGFTDTVKQRQAAGDMGALAGTLAQVTYSEALMQQATSESQLAEAEAALQAVTGLDLKTWPRLPRELSQPPAQVDANLLQSLPALAVLRSRMKTAKARIRLMEREGRADPTIGIRAGREGSENLLGLSFEIPLFVRNNFKSGIRAASFDAVEEELAYRDAHRRAKARLDGSLARFQNTSRAWQSWVFTGQQAQREQMSLLGKMWQAGELTATDYLIQAKQNIDTQMTASALMGEVWQAAIGWLDASANVGDWLGLASTQIKNSGE